MSLVHKCSLPRLRLFYENFEKCIDTKTEIISSEYIKYISHYIVILYSLLMILHTHDRIKY